MVNIGVFVSGGGTNLQAIIDGISSGKITNGEIKIVLSSKDDVYALERAKNNNIQTAVVRRKDYPDKNLFSQKIEEAIKDYNLDLIVVAGFLSVLSDDFLKNRRNKIINVHPALIPSFCGDSYYGLKVHEKALERGVKLSGATVHFVNEITDGGPIIMQKAVEVKDDDTPEILQKRIMIEAEQIILVEAVNLFCNNKLSIIDNKVHLR